MIGWVLLAMLVGIFVTLTFYTWLDRFMVPMERWNAKAYSAGLALGGLATAAVVSLAAGW